MVPLDYYSNLLDIHLRANSAESDQTALISLHYSMVLKHYIMLKQQLFRVSEILDNYCNSGKTPVLMLNSTEHEIYPAH